MEQPGDGVLAAKIFPEALPNRRLEAIGVLKQRQIVGHCFKGTLVAKLPLEFFRLPLQTAVSAARAVELYLTPEHRGR